MPVHTVHPSDLPQYFEFVTELRGLLEKYAPQLKPEGLIAALIGGMLEAGMLAQATPIELIASVINAVQLVLTGNGSDALALVATMAGRDPSGVTLVEIGEEVYALVKSKSGVDGKLRLGALAGALLRFGQDFGFSTTSVVEAVAVVAGITDVARLQEARAARIREMLTPPFDVH